MKTLTLFILFLLPLLSSGQSFSQFITNDAILNIVCQKLPQYDSLIFYSESGFWNPNTRLKGIAYFGVKRYLICIEFSFPLTVKNNKYPYFREELINYALPTLIENNGFSSWSQDSIEIDVCKGPKAFLRMSDGPTSTIVMLYPKQMKRAYRQVYNAELNQSQCPNGDREEFIALFKALSKLLPIDVECEVKRDFFTY